MSGGARQQAVTAGTDGSDADKSLRAARVRRSAWALAILAIACYLGFIVWSAIRGPL